MPSRSYPSALYFLELVHTQQVGGWAQGWIGHARAHAHQLLWLRGCLSFCAQFYFWQHGRANRIREQQQQQQAGKEGPGAAQAGFKAEPPDVKMEG